MGFIRGARPTLWVPRPRSVESRVRADFHARKWPEGPWVLPSQISMGRETITKGPRLKPPFFAGWISGALKAPAPSAAVSWAPRPCSVESHVRADFHACGWPERPLVLPSQISMGRETITKGPRLKPPFFAGWISGALKAPAPSADIDGAGNNNERSAAKATLLCRLDFRGLEGPCSLRRDERHTPAPRPYFVTVSVRFT